jgi:hypothetical protein
MAELIKLSDLVTAEGFGFMINARPASLETALGEPNPYCCVQDLGQGKFAIACVADSIDYVYSAAHEIAELAHGFKHSEELFSEQAGILARWCKRLQGEVDGT